MSIVFYHNDEQKRLAMETRDREAAKINGEIFTEIVPASEFYRAEAYHQKYRLRHVPELMEEFSVIYPDDDDFVDSTVAARLNGYLAGHGTFKALEAELSGLGLSLEGNERLLDIVYALDH
jgi:peptide-methionine (S)-S-oxide reductase